MTLMKDTMLDADVMAEWDGPDVVSLRTAAIDEAYDVYRDLGLTAKPEGKAGDALVVALCARRGWTIEVRRVSMADLPTYSGFVRIAGPDHWVIDVRDDVSDGQADLIIAHEVGHIIHGDVPSEGRARPRVIPITPPEVWASAFAVTMGRLFTYGDPEGERAAALAHLTDMHRALIGNLPRRV